MRSSRNRNSVLAFSFVGLLFTILALPRVMAQDIPVIDSVEAQPFKAQANRIAQALEFLGQPLGDEEQKKLKAAVDETDDAPAVKQIQEIFDPLTIASVNINPESRVKVAVGPTKKRLVQEGWSIFWSKYIIRLVSLLR